MEDRWLSVAEITEYLGVTRDSIYRWIDSRNMPGHRVGRHWKFRKDEVDEWVRSGGAGENDSRRCLNNDQQ
ncbi:MAG TPA: helix-turn-helix domain-containing protein [Armatimonadota bacterium]|nr:helix-turn-helix domain-containing protein [Armatimonadota bacterium]HPP74900.1 helix-turn-helix domain-containing protein [Armatimonadota bacterium]